MCKAIDDLREESREEGIALGEARGHEKSQRQTTHNLFQLGMSIPDIAKVVEKDETVIKEWVASFG